MKTAKRNISFVAAGMVIVAIVAGVILGTGSAGAKEKSLDLIPETTNMAISADFEGLMEVPMIRDAIKNSDNSSSKEFREKLAKYDITMQDICKHVLIFGDVSVENTENAVFGALMTTGVAESKLQKILQKESEAGEINYKQEQRDGKTIYFIDNQKGQNLAEQTAVTYLDPTRMLVSTGGNIYVILQQIKDQKTLATSPMQKMANVREESLIWGVYENPNPTQPEEGNDGQAYKDISDAVFYLDSMDAANESLQMDLQIETGSKATAQKMYAQIQQFAGMIPMMFMQNPELGQKVTEAIELKSGEKKFQLTVTFDQKLAEKLADHIKKQSQGQSRTMQPKNVPSPQK